MAETTPKPPLGVAEATGGGSATPVGTIGWLKPPPAPLGTMGVAEPPLGAQGGGYGHPSFSFPFF